MKVKLRWVLSDIVAEGRESDMVTVPLLVKEASEECSAVNDLVARERVAVRDSVFTGGDGVVLCDASRDHVSKVFE